MYNSQKTISIKYVGFNLFNNIHRAVPTQLLLL